MKWTVIRMFTLGILWSVYISIEKIYRPIGTGMETKNKLSNSVESYTAQREVEFMWKMIFIFVISVTIVLIILEMAKWYKKFKEEK